MMFPETTVESIYGEKISLVSYMCKNKNVRGIFIVFFPFAFSSVCADELSELSTITHQLEEQGVAIIAVSCDSKFSLRVFHAQQGFEFEMASDFWPHGKLASELEIFDQDKGISDRITFLVDDKGHIIDHFSSDPSKGRIKEQYFASIQKIG